MEELYLYCTYFTGSSWTIENFEIIDMEKINKNIYNVGYEKVLSDKGFKTKFSVTFVSDALYIMFYGDDPRYKKYGNMWISLN